MGVGEHGRGFSSPSCKWSTSAKGGKRLGKRARSGTPAWHRYQQDAAALLTKLGFATHIDEKIVSRSGVVHAIDVSARRLVAGVQVLWLVECKLWRSAVPKEKVAALAAIGEDVGADRCLLMSEAGFQSGALMMANGRNITLTSLHDLRANAATDLLTLRQRHAEQRLRVVEQQMKSWRPPSISDLVAHVVHRVQRAHQRDAFNEIDAAPEAMVLTGDFPDALPVSAPWADGLNVSEAQKLAESARDLQAALDQAALDRWPVTLRDHEGQCRVAYNIRQILGVVEPALDALNARVTIQDKRMQAGYRQCQVPI